MVRAAAYTAHVESCAICQGELERGAVAIIVTDRLVAEHERRVRTMGAPLAASFAQGEVD